MSVLAMGIAALVLLTTGFVLGVTLALFANDRVNRPTLQNECALNPEKLELPIYSWEPNDLGIYRTVGEAEIYFEPWIVEEPVEFFDGAGRRLQVEPIPATHSIRLHLDDSKASEPEQLAAIIRQVVLDIKGISLPDDMLLKDLNSYVLLNQIDG